MDGGGGWWMVDAGWWMLDGGGWWMVDSRKKSSPISLKISGWSNHVESYIWDGIA